MAVLMKRPKDRVERILKWYPNVHLFGNVWLVRNAAYEARRFSTWYIVIMYNDPEEVNNG